ncbi:magnesium transporter MgtE N-terminal domain-containing protein [Solwaraspora sp. WMMB335]|uniref:magnesium transporter MgtE N-terminal domain-containing protein n=1 Tax=Solwaraspora sp. WMMB335 TaxID=3404118 RepID=UPI003B93D4CD
MPVTQLIAMVRSTPPRQAVGLLAAMPADRLPVVVAELQPADLIRLLPAAGNDLRTRMLALLTADQLADLARAMPVADAVEILARLPTGQVQAVANRLPQPTAAALLGALPTDRQAELLSVMRPQQAQAAWAGTYQREVAEALTRANAEVSIPADAPAGIVLVQIFGWRITVAARRDDDGRIAVRDAEDAAYRLRANAALAVTDYQPATDVLDYCDEARRQGRPISAVSWTDNRHDGYLKRALVGLVQ